MKLKHRLILTLSLFGALLFTFQNCANNNLPPTSSKQLSAIDEHDNNNGYNYQGYDYSANNNQIDAAQPATDPSLANPPTQGGTVTSTDPNNSGGTTTQQPSDPAPVTPPPVIPPVVSNPLLYKLNLTWYKSDTDLTRNDSTKLTVTDDFSATNGGAYDLYFLKLGLGTGSTVKLPVTLTKQSTGYYAMRPLTLDKQGYYYITDAGSTARRSESVLVIYDDLNYRSALLRNYISTFLIKNADAYAKLKANSLACISTAANCANGRKIRIKRLYNSAGSVVFDWDVSAKGFMATGQNCSSFNNLIGHGHAYCSYRPEVFATTYCANNAATCATPSKITFSLELFYHSNNETAAPPSPSSLKLTFDRTSGI